MSITTSRPNSCRKSSASLGDESNRQRIVAVHVENRRLDHLRDVGGIHRRARVLRQSGETDLVIDHGVDRAAGAVAVQLRHVQRLGDDPLPRESRVAMNEQAAEPCGDARCRRECAAARGPIPSTTGSTASRWLGLAARRISTSAPAGKLSNACDNRGDISRRRRRRRGPECSSSLNSVKITLSDLLQKIRQHIEPAAMRHAHADFLDAGRRAAHAEWCRE